MFSTITDNLPDSVSFMVSFMVVLVDFTVRKYKHNIEQNKSSSTVQNMLQGVLRDVEVRLQDARRLRPELTRAEDHSEFLRHLCHGWTASASAAVSPTRDRSIIDLVKSKSFRSTQRNFILSLAGYSGVLPGAD